MINVVKVAGEVVRATVETFVEEDAGAHLLEDREWEHVGRVAQWAFRVVGELESFAMPHCLTNNDVHINNITSTGLVFDWGDTYITHPLAALFTINRLVGEYSAEFNRVVVEVCRDVIGMVGVFSAKLKSLSGHARVYSSVGKMLTWLQVLRYPQGRIVSAVVVELVNHYRVLLKDLHRQHTHVLA